VNLFAGEDCHGPAVATGTPEELASPGFTVDVPHGATEEFSANVETEYEISGCSQAISYTDSIDPSPSVPVLGSTEPPSPGESERPRILGSARAGDTIEVYSGPSCLGSAVATGTAAELESPGIEVTVPEGSERSFSATATNRINETSPCSAPISYIHSVRPPTISVPLFDRGPSETTPPPSSTSPPPAGKPSCTVPRLSGKTLAKAKVALKAAACALGKVIKPKHQAQALVVGASSPATGAKTSGAVSLHLVPQSVKRHH
jgi:hypothetical protein